MRGLFISIVVGSFALYAALFSTPHIWHYLYDEETLFLLRYNGFGSPINIDWPVAYLYLLAYGIVSFGLVKFHSWARKGFVILTVLSILLTPIWGVAVIGAFEGVLGNLVFLGHGAILAIAFLTKIDNDFQPVA